MERLPHDREAFEVPAEIKNLSGLRILILPFLGNVKFKRVFDSSILRDGQEEIELLESLQKMQSLEEISLNLNYRRGFEKLMICHRVLHHLRELSLFGCTGFNGLDPFLIPSSTLRSLQQVDSLYIGCVNVTKVDIGGDYVEPSPPKTSTFTRPDSFNCLRQVCIFGCKKLCDVTSLIYHAPVLETLFICRCDSLKEVIVGDIDGSNGNDHRLFQCLKYLWLSALRSLETICSTSLPFPALKDISVLFCPKLKKLPLNRDSAKNSLQVITVTETQWDNLEWDDPAAKQVFSPLRSSLASESVTSKSNKVAEEVRRMQELFFQIKHDS